MSQRERAIQRFLEFLDENPGAQILVATDVWEQLQAACLAGDERVKAWEGIKILVGRHLPAGTVTAFDPKEEAKLNARKNGR
jgi:hypothetical protein